MQIKIRIIDNERGNPPGKVADAELEFLTGPLTGLKLIGFAIWQRRYGSGGFNVTFPARAYAVNGERRSFALLRPATSAAAQDRIRDQIIRAYQEHQEQSAEQTTYTPPDTPERFSADQDAIQQTVQENHQEQQQPEPKITEAAARAMSAGRMDSFF